MLAENIPVICLMGPTATGKTDAAAALFDEIDCEIISVDSSLVYQSMNIGTAKPDADFLRRYPHHLVDIRAPQDSYSVAEFYNDAIALIKDITARDKVPVLAGGTMFYFNALESGLNTLPEANQMLRDELNQQAKQLGWPAMRQKLAELDPQRAEQLDPNDAQRIQRALEIVLQSGQSVAQLSQQKQSKLINPLLKIALVFSDRKYLHQRIEQRFDIMLEAGLQQEVECLLAAGVPGDCSAMKMIGYRQMQDYLSGDCDYQQMRLKGISATRQLAKRQLTWLRNQSNVIWWADSGLKRKKYGKLIQYVNQNLLEKAYNPNVSAL